LIQTDFGVLHGTSWERFCQSAFKLRYGDHYRDMLASPGDYGSEGWTTDDHGFRCYRPEKNYTQDEFYEAIRRKITHDIPKLKRYESDISVRTGAAKIRKRLRVRGHAWADTLRKHALHPGDRS
jgi:hypothetical protein